MQKSKIGQRLYEEPNGKLESSCNFISSDSIWFINLTNCLEKEKKKKARCSVPNQLPGTGPTLGTDHGSLARILSLSSPLFCVRD